MATRKELVKALRVRCGSAAFGERIEILDPFVALTGCYLKHAIRVLCAEVPKKGAGCADYADCAASIDRMLAAPRLHIDGQRKRRMGMGMGRMNPPRCHEDAGANADRWGVQAGDG